MGVSRELQIGKAGEHFVVADLIIQGYNAFLSDQGLNYDVVIDLETKLLRVQVRTTSKPLIITRTVRSKKGSKKFTFQENVYRFGMRSGKNSRTINNYSVDVFAFFAIDIRKVAYIPAPNLFNKDGNLIQTFEIRDGESTYSRQLKRWGRMFDNYKDFTYEI